MTDLDWECLECGHLMSLPDAEEASCGDGCPECGGSDVDLHIPETKSSFPERSEFLCVCVEGMWRRVVVKPDLSGDVPWKQTFRELEQMFGICYRWDDDLGDWIGSGRHPYPGGLNPPGNMEDLTHDWGKTWEDLR